MVTVVLPVEKPMNAAFLSFLYPAGDDGSLMVKSDVFGSLAEAHVRISPAPVERKLRDGYTPVQLRLPANAATRGLEKGFPWYSPSDVAALNMALDSVVGLDLAGYYRRGELLGFAKKDIVEAYIQSRGLCDMGGFDTLHKRVYRREMEGLRDLRDRLLRRLYYIDESISFKGLER